VLYILTKYMPAASWLMSMLLVLRVAWISCLPSTLWMMTCTANGASICKIDVAGLGYSFMRPAAGALPMPLPPPIVMMNSAVVSVQQPLVVITTVYLPDALALNMLAVAPAIALPFKYHW